ncbi:MAG: hypothetical protein V4490_03880, partial [Pseudomonadota bacterium]
MPDELLNQKLTIITDLQKQVEQLFQEERELIPPFMSAQLAFDKKLKNLLHDAYLKNRAFGIELQGRLGRALMSLKSQDNEYPVSEIQTEHQLFPSNNPGNLIAHLGGQSALEKLRDCLAIEADPISSAPVPKLPALKRLWAYLRQNALLFQWAFAQISWKEKRAQGNNDLSTLSRKTHQPGVIRFFNVITLFLIRPIIFILYDIPRAFFNTVAQAFRDMRSLHWPKKSEHEPIIKDAKDLEAPTERTAPTVPSFNTSTSGSPTYFSHDNFLYVVFESLRTAFDSSQKFTEQNPITIVSFCTGLASVPGTLIMLPDQVAFLLRQLQISITQPLGFKLIPGIQEASANLNHSLISMGADGLSNEGLALMFSSYLPDTSSVHAIAASTGMGIGIAGVLRNTPGSRALFLTNYILGTSSLVLAYQAYQDVSAASGPKASFSQSFARFVLEPILLLVRLPIAAVSSLIHGNFSDYLKPEL